MDNTDLKRYWVFAGDFYYPEGGISDLHATFDDFESACDYVDDFLRQWKEDFKCAPDQFDIWFHIFDTVTNKIVKEGL